MLTDSEMFDRMKNGWRAGAPETVCGNGSLAKNTKNIREWLPKIFKKYKIKSIADAGAGDMHWREDMPGQSLIKYFPFDLIPRHELVQKLDITAEIIPVKVDAIICRMVLNHLDDGRIFDALRNFRKSGAKYLIATQFSGKNLANRSRQFTRLDLTERLGEPIADCSDGNEP